MIECPLCKRKSNDDYWETRFPTDPVEIDNQIDNLDHAFEDLRSEQASLLRLIENRIEMCPMCQELMNGIEDESDRRELENRINEQVEKLEERAESYMSGSL